MFRKSILIAIATAGTFGLASLSTTSASAMPGYHGPAKVSAARVAGPRVIGKVSLRTPNRPGVTIHPRLPRPHWHVHYRYRRIWVAPRPVVYGAVTPVVTGRCTCLTKEYTPEGAVLFKDICTNEAAINPPAMAPTAQVQPQQ